MAGEFVFRVFDRPRFDQIRAVLEAVARGQGAPDVAAVARQAVTARGPARELDAALAGRPTPRRNRDGAVYAILKALCWPQYTGWGRYGFDDLGMHPCLAMLGDCDGGLWGPLADKLPWFERWTCDHNNESVSWDDEAAIVLMARPDCERLHTDLQSLAADLTWLEHPRPHVRTPDLRFAPLAFAHLRAVVGRAVDEPGFTLSFECSS